MRAITETKLQYLRDHSKMLDAAFEELIEVHNEELDLVHEKIQELDNRLKDKGF